MRTEEEIKTHRRGDAAPTRIEELWHDPDIPPEHLVHLDPLDITREMLKQAESPDLVNYWLARLKATSDD